MKIIKKTLFSIAAIACTGGIIAGDMLYSRYKTDILGQLCPPTVDTEAANASAASGKELAEEIEEDGIVMVKNDGLLPMDINEVDSINLLGYGNVQWVYGGSGSGRIYPESDNWDDCINLAKALDSYGVNVNEDILEYYTNYSKPNYDIDSLNFNVDTNPYKFGLKDPDVETDSNYKDMLDDNLDYASTCIVTISRQGGESEDMPKVQYKSMPEKSVDESRHSLQISQEEENLLNYAQENYEHVIVIINSTNAFQLDFLADMDGIDACLVVGATGEYGANAIPKILYGDASPSGKLADILPYDFTKNINYNYTGYDGVSFYSNTDIEYGVNQTTNAGVSKRSSLPYVDYVEGIYVGYRYYETADREGAFDTLTRKIYDNENNLETVNGYDAVVQYPFGYGLSYTTFDWEVIDLSLKDNSELSEDTEIKITVKVTNTGSVPGKDVVELYMTPQYNEGEVEKSYMNLVAFEKTEEIEPGENETLELTVKARDFASYDCYDLNDNGYTTYEIDKGTYELKFASDSHNVKNINFLSGSKNVPGILTYTANEDIILDTDSKTGAKIDNLFTGSKAVDGVSIDGLTSDGENADIDYVSRTDLKNITEPISKSSTSREMGTGTKQYVLFAGADRKDRTKADKWDNAKVDAFGNATHTSDVTFGKSSNLKICDSDGNVTETGYKLGENYNDPLWDDVLDFVTYSEAMNFINKAHPKVNAIESIGMPALNNYDGPAQVGSFTTKELRGTGYPCDSVLAQTWNKTLCYEQGLSLGEDMEAHGLSGYYGTAINIHRSPFGGRNYEYFSEDPVLTGDLAAKVVSGVRSTGKIAFVKHIAVAETETCRDSLYTWLSEQTLREIYLEPFRRVVEDGNANGMMTSYNRVGALWTGGSTALLQGILRTEWGFKGSVITDYSDNNQYMNLDETLRAGGDLGMSVSLSFQINESSSNRIKYALREAIHHTVYAYLDSKVALREYNKNPYNGKTIKSANTKESFNWVTPVVIDINIILAVMALSFIYFGVLDAIGLNKDKKQGETQNEIKK